MLAALLATSLLTPTPQLPPSGFFMNYPAVVTGKGVPNDKELLLANPGTSVQYLSQFDPRFSRAAIFGPNPPNIEFGSFSSGNAFVTAQMHATNGRACAELGNNRWCFQIYSVTGTTTGQMGSIYQAEGDSVESALFSYVAPGSSGIPSTFVGNIDKIRDGGEMGVSDIVGIDTYMNSLLLGGVPTGPLALYFTVTAATKNNIPTSWGQNRLPSTIYKVQYNEGNNSWDPPTEEWVWSELGLSPDTEIDALTVDAAQGRILLSTTEQDLDRQLWLVWFAPPFPHPPYKDPYYNAAGSALYVVSNLGFIDKDLDGIDGLCADDPLKNEQAADDRHRWRARSTAFPLTTFYPLIPAQNLRFGAHRERFSLDTELYRFTLSHHVNELMPDDTVAQLDLILGSTRIPLGKYVRNNGNNVDQITHVALSSNEAATLGLRLRFQWTVNHSGGPANTHMFEFFR